MSLQIHVLLKNTVGLSVETFFQIPYLLLMEDICCTSWIGKMIARTQKSLQATQTMFLGAMERFRGYDLMVMKNKQCQRSGRSRLAEQAKTLHPTSSLIST